MSGRPFSLVSQKLVRGEESPDAGTNRTLYGPRQQSFSSESEGLGSPPVP